VTTAARRLAARKGPDRRGGRRRARFRHRDRVRVRPPAVGRPAWWRICSGCTARSSTRA